MPPTRRDCMLTFAGAGIALVAACSAGPVPIVYEYSSAETQLPPADGIITDDALSLFNAYRLENRLETVQADAELGRGAFEHARAMAGVGRISHDRLNARLQALSVTNGAENVGFGQTSILQVMEEWAASPGHRRNLLGPFSRFGMALATDERENRVPYWAMLLAA